jgi:hypothetical protein
MILAALKMSQISLLDGNHDLLLPQRSLDRVRISKDVVDFFQ